MIQNIFQRSPGVRSIHRRDDECVPGVSTQIYLFCIDYAKASLSLKWKAIRSEVSDLGAKIFVRYLKVPQVPYFM